MASMPARPAVRVDMVLETVAHECNQKNCNMILSLLPQMFLRDPRLVVPSLLLASGEKAQAKMETMVWQYLHQV